MATVDISKIEPKEIIKGFKGKFIHTENTTLAFWEVEKAQTVESIAFLSYRTTEQGGRSIPVFNAGYRPQIKFEFSEMHTSREQRILNKKIVYPGDKVEAEIKLLTTDFLENRLTEGMNFEFREGSKIIGIGNDNY